MSGKKMQKRVVITGGAGFIGSHLCERFLNNNNMEIICLDNLLTGSLSNIEHLFKNKNFNFIKQDVTNYIHIPGRIDYILHFASPASPIDYLKLPIQTLKVGALGTHKILGLAKEKNARFLLASTSEVYGDPLIHPQKEDYPGNVDPIGPRGVYDEAKRFGEAITMAYHRFHNVNTGIIRIFNTYGPRMRENDGRVVPAFICQALRGKPLTVFGDGSQTRSFCYIDDMVVGIEKLLLSAENNPINIGNPDEMTVLQFAETINKLTNSNCPIEYKPLPEGDPKVRNPNIELAQDKLNWEPEVILEQGLKNTIEYFKENIKI